MPELPDITIYIEALGRRVLNTPLNRVRIKSPFLLRTFEPPVEAVEGKPVSAIERIGKRIVFCFDPDLFLVLHLMIAGRLLWIPAPGSNDAPSKGAPRKPLASKVDLATFEFSSGTLLLTEAGTKKRASLHVVRSREALSALDPGGVDPFGPDLEPALTAVNRTLKRALTDPTIISGIGNAYSDEILFTARLSPFKLTRSLSAEELTHLRAAIATTMAVSTNALRAQFGMPAPGAPSPLGRFPGVGEVTAFRPEHFVHGRYNQPCKVCTSPIQRVVYAENEMNYCPTCQTEGRLLADRSLSRLLKDDWPRTLEELEELKASTPPRAPEPPARP